MRRSGECQATPAWTVRRCTRLHGPFDSWRGDWNSAAVPAPAFARVDHLVIAVRDLGAATAAYGAMLGLVPSWRGTHPAYGTANTIFGLANCYLELLAPVVDPPAHPVAHALTDYLARRAEGLFAVALGSDDLTATVTRLVEAGLHPGPIGDGEARDGGGTTRGWRSSMLAASETRGLSLFAIEHRDSRAIAPAVPTGAPEATVTAVDHVVVFTDDLDGALALWRDAFGIPERWRRAFAERGTINVGLRLGGCTLELVGPLVAAESPRAEPRGERLWGLAYVVADCDAAVGRLRAAGIATSDARSGLAPSTRVATVKWSDRTPTLLIQHQV
jgi:catechol 2,3-dioxygenase-like lactoylglutathione lyase family enzyme